jgi:hypothetical protein
LVAGARYYTASNALSGISDGAEPRWSSDMAAQQENVPRVAPDRAPVTVGE